MAIKRFSLQGLLKGEPTSTGSGQPTQTTSFILDFQHDYPREDSDTVSVASTDGTPYTLLTAAVPSVRLFALRVVSGGPIKVKVTSAVGTDQAFNVSGQMIWESPALGDELTSIKLVGTGDVEYLVAGDAVAGVIPPVSGSSTSIFYDDGAQVETTDTSEVVAMEFAAPFALIPGSFINVEYIVSGIMNVSGGTGTVRLRRGGSIGAADGTVEVSGTVTEASPTLKEFSADVAHPVGTQLVKITIEHPTGGQTLTVRSLAVIINGV